MRRRRERQRVQSRDSKSSGGGHWGHGRACVAAGGPHVPVTDPLVMKHVSVSPYVQLKREGGQLQDGHDPTPRRSVSAADSPRVRHTARVSRLQADTAAPAAAAAAARASAAAALSRAGAPSSASRRACSCARNVAARRCRSATPLSAASSRPVSTRISASSATSSTAAPAVAASVATAPQRRRTRGGLHAPTQVGEERTASRSILFEFATGGATTVSTVSTQQTGVRPSVSQHSTTFSLGY